MRTHLLLLLLALVASSVRCHGAKKLVVVLIDGVRWDYLHDSQLKGFKRIMEHGVMAHKVVPVYPSLSYPNWQTLITGLYPENHGFVGNEMLDNQTGSAKIFGMLPGADNPMWWNDAEPVWVTSEKSGKQAALYWWGGCEVEIAGTHPMICERNRYGPPAEEETLDFLERIDDMANLFKSTKSHPDGRLSLAMMYYGGVDYAGHFSGPDSQDRKDAMADIDYILDKMQDKFKSSGLEKEVNIMIISDHGMTDIRKAKKFSLDPFSSLIQLQVSAGPFAMILPEDGKLDQLYDSIMSAKVDGVKVYKKQDIPEELHLKNSNRTTPLILKANPGYLITSVKDRKKIVGGDHSYMLATHGYDPQESEDMNTVFLATGPDFKAGYESETLHTTDLYNIMCSVLDIRPLPNNGSWPRVKTMLVNSDDPSSLEQTTLSSTASCDRFTSYLQLLVALSMAVVFSKVA